MFHFIYSGGLQHRTVLRPGDGSLYPSRRRGGEVWTPDAPYAPLNGILTR